MSTFVELKSTWENQKKEYGIETLIAEKFSVLVQDETEEGVSSCFQLLLSFGNEGICGLLFGKEVPSTKWNGMFWEALNGVL